MPPLSQNQSIIPRWVQLVCWIFYNNWTVKGRKQLKLCGEITKECLQLPVEIPYKAAKRMQVPRCNKRLLQKQVLIFQCLFKGIIIRHQGPRNQSPHFQKMCISITEQATLMRELYRIVGNMIWVRCESLVSPIIISFKSNHLAVYC